MQKLFVIVGVSCLFALTANAQKGKKAKPMVVPPAKKSPIAIIDPSLGLNNMVTLQPGKTWVWLGDFFPYVSAIDSVTVPKNHPGAGISNLRYAWNRGAGDSLRGKGSVCDSMQLWWEGDDYGNEPALQYFQIWSAGKSTTVPVPLLTTLPVPAT